MEFDDLHDLTPDPDPVDPIEDPIDPDNLEPDPEEPFEHVIVDGDDPKPPGDDPKDPEESDVKLSGIEQYLSSFDIEGGMIKFDDGTSKHFNELEADKQAEILSQLHEQSAKSVEDKFGLDENEIGLINYLRESNKTIEDVVNEMAAKRVQSILASQQSDSTDYDKLADDAVYTAFLKQSNPEATLEQIEKDLETAKSMATYANMVKNLRATFKTNQELNAEKARIASAKEMEAQLEGERKLVVNTVSKLQDVDGVTIDDSMKNSVLDIILSVDQDGDSQFMTEVFSDPQKLFKAAFWYKNGADILKAKEDYWKKEKSAAFKRGQETPLGKRTFTDTTKNRTTPQSSFDDSEYFDDIH